MSLKAMTGISPRSWLKLARWTIFGTLGCVAISTSFNYVYFAIQAPEALTESLVSAAIIPILLAGPLFFYLTLKLRELAIANHRLRLLASTDSLTECLNRAAFTARVEQHLGGASPAGALLVIDADHFKSINDRFGHHVGDEALQRIATAIRTNLRKDDLCGRLGGEEFGVYLPRASHSEALVVAERIREAVHRCGFAPAGTGGALSVSVGGAIFEGRTDFALLFRTADERLYSAKHAGRDRVEVTIAPAASDSGQLAVTLH